MTDHTAGLPLPEQIDANAPILLKAQLNNTLQKLKSVVATMNISSAIMPYSGEDSKRFADWINDCERFAILTRVDTKDIKLLAFQTSREPISSYIRRRLDNAITKNETWAEFKSNLAARFSFITDESVAFLMLRNARQEESESVVLFSERLINLVDNCFLAQEVDSAYVEKELLNIFINGLRSETLMYRLMKANPHTLNDAISIALNEETMRKRFDLRTGREANFEGRPSQPMTSNQTVPTNNEREEIEMEVNHQDT